MKRSIWLVLLLALVCAGAHAQEPIYLFPDFTQATFKLKTHIKTSARINIDAKYQKIFFLQGDDVMEMTNGPLIDTLYVDGRKFVWRNDCLCEYVQRDYGDIYINWKLRDTPSGKIGAMGTVTQQKVEVMQVPGLNSEYSYTSTGHFSDKTDVWTVKNENTYFWVMDGFEYRIRRPSDLYRYFYKKEDAIKQFMRHNNLTMKSAEEAEMIFKFIYEN